LVVASWVDDQVAQDLAGGGVDDGDVEVLTEQDDVGSGVGPAEADVAEPFLQRLLEAFDLALGLWVVGLAVLLGDVELA
jgi:hypothetical protein